MYEKKKIKDTLGSLVCWVDPQLRHEPPACMGFNDAGTRRHDNYFNGRRRFAANRL